ILACLCFIFVFMARGLPRTTAVVGQVDAGSPAWQKGIRSGDRITRIGDTHDPWFDDIKPTIMLSQKGPLIPLSLGPRGGGNVRDILIEPRCDENDTGPVIGIAPTYDVKLLPGAVKQDRKLPVSYTSAAAAARPLGLRSGDIVLATTDPDDVNAV